MTAQLYITCTIILVVPSRQTFCIRSEYSCISVFFIGLKKTSLIAPSTLIINGAKITFEKYCTTAISLSKLLQFFAFFRFLKFSLTSNEHTSILMHFVSSINNRTLGSFLRPNWKSFCLGKSHNSVAYSFPKLFLWYAKITSQLCWTYIFDMPMPNISVMCPDLYDICANFGHSLRMYAIVFSFPLHNLHVEDISSLLMWCFMLFFLDFNLAQSSIYHVSFFTVPFQSQFQLNFYWAGLPLCYREYHYSFVLTFLTSQKAFFDWFKTFYC